MEGYQDLVPDTYLAWTWELLSAKQVHWEVKPRRHISGPGTEDLSLSECSAGGGARKGGEES